MDILYINMFYWDFFQPMVLDIRQIHMTTRSFMTFVLRRLSLCFVNLIFSLKSEQKESTTGAIGSLLVLLVAIMSSSGDNFPLPCLLHLKIRRTSRFNHHVVGMVPCQRRWESYLWKYPATVMPGILYLLCNVVEYFWDP